MSQTFHTPWENIVTNYSAASMNVPLGQLDAKLVELATVIYELGGCFENKPVSSEVILRVPITRVITFPVGMDESRMVSEYSATASTSFSIRKNGVEFASATFAAGANYATFTGNLTSFTDADILTVVAPPSADATLENIGWCLTATRITILPI